MSARRDSPSLPREERVGVREQGSGPRIRSVAIAFLLPLTLTVISGCGPDYQQQQAKRDADAKTKYDAEAKKFATPARGLAELKRQLKSRVNVKDGFVVVQGGFLRGTSVLPISTPWMVNCGFLGMTITFGTSVSGDRDDVGNDAQVQLAYPGMKCADQAIPIAHEVRILLSGK